ncbi:MAG: hypothetical protein AAF289_19885, partial [Cyanobacteria bacterium P01_A01_bin.135]
MTDTLLRPPVDPNTPDTPNTKLYNRLKAALRLNLRRQIFIAVCDDLALRDRLADQLQKEVTYAAISARRRGQLAEARRLRIYPRLVTLNLDLADPNPINQMSQWLRQFPPPAAAGSAMPAFQLLGIEQLSRQPASSQWLFLNHLQAVERNLPALESSLLLWVPRPWGRMIPQSAPDFWRCRTAVFEFEGDPTPLPAASLPQSTVPTSIFLQPQRQRPLPQASANLSDDEVALLKAELAMPTADGVPAATPDVDSPQDRTPLPAADAALPLAAASDHNGALAEEPPTAETPAETVEPNHPLPQTSAVEPAVVADNLPTAQADDLSQALRELLGSDEPVTESAIESLSEPAASLAPNLPADTDGAIAEPSVEPNPFEDALDSAIAAGPDTAAIDALDTPAPAVAEPVTEAMGEALGSATDEPLTEPPAVAADRAIDAASPDASLAFPPLEEDDTLDLGPLDPFGADLSPSDADQLDPFDLDLDTAIEPPSDAALDDASGDAQMLVEDAPAIPDDATDSAALPLAEEEDELTVSDASPSYVFPGMASADEPALPLSTTSHEDLVRLFTEQTSDPRVLSVLQQIQGLQQQQAPPMVLAGAYRALGNLFRDRIEKGEISPSTLQMAMLAYQQVLHWASEKSPMRAEVLNDMGNLSWLLSRCGQGPEQALPHLHQSIQAYQEALTQIAPDTHPQTYPMIQNNLGAAYGDLARYQNPPENLQKSIQAYQEALRYRSAEQDPMRYASTQNNLGTTYWNLAQHLEPIQHLKAAIAAYDSALTYYQPEQDALNYAMIQNNLGTAYWNLAQHEHSEEWLRQATQAYKLALEYRTLEASPA